MRVWEEEGRDGLSNDDDDDEKRLHGCLVLYYWILDSYVHNF